MMVKTVELSLKRMHTVCPKDDEAACSTIGGAIIAFGNARCTHIPRDHCGAQHGDAFVNLTCG
jgi:hypothetical protein